MSSAEQKYNVPGLDRALTIIELLNEKPAGLSVNEISAELKFPVNSVYRIMSTLERRNYGEANRRDGLRFFPKNFWDSQPPWWVTLLSSRTPSPTCASARRHQGKHVGRGHVGKRGRSP